MKENHRAKVPKQVVRISWAQWRSCRLPGSSCARHGQLPGYPNKRKAGSRTIPLDWFPISGHTTNRLASWFAGAWPSQCWDHRAFAEL